MEKKSERMEVRLGYQEKQAFTEACENQGDTPSGAIRRFINGYVRRADADLLSSAWRNFRNRKMVVGGGLIAVATASFLLFSALTNSDNSLMGELGSPSSALIEASNSYPREGVSKPIASDPNDAGPALQPDLFERWDKDGNGTIDVGEILPNDKHLHRVLDTDGVPGISLAEFWASGRMTYREVDEVTSEENDKNMSFRFENGEPQRLVDFDLKNSRPRIGVYLVTNQTNSMSPDRTIIWEQGKLKPSVNFSRHEFRVRRALLETETQTTN